MTPQAANGITVVVELSPSSADTMIDELNPTTPDGTDTNPLVRSGTVGSAERILMKFDLSSIPTSVVSNAYLQMHYSGWFTGDPVGKTITANRVTKNWVETEATWNAYSTGNNWGTAGGDYTATGAASSTVPASFVYMNWTVTDIVKDWIEGGQPNYGFLLRDPTDGSAGTETATRFRAREAPQMEELPILKIEYTTLPVGGVVMPTNKFEVMTPFLALAGLIVAVSAVVVVKRRRD